MPGFICCFLCFIFFSLGFLQRTFMNPITAGEWEAISLTPLFHFYLFHKHLDISRAVIAER